LASRLPRCSPLAMTCLRCDLFSENWILLRRRIVEQVVEVGQHAIDQF
jgi:hypothetical protein